MNESRRLDLRFLLYVLATIGLWIAGAYLLARAMTGLDLREPPLVGVALAAALLAALAFLTGWFLERRAASRKLATDEWVRRRLEIEMQERQASLAEARRAFDEEARNREAAVAETRAALEAEVEKRDVELEQTTAQLEEEVGRERDARREAQRSQASAARAIAQMRNEIFSLHRERGVLGDASDVPQMILRVAMTLLEAPKGLLLSREDRNRDSKLDLVASAGFDNDPKDSAIAQRFATEVLEQDRTIREDQPHDEEHGDSAGSDAEIESLLAIPIYILDEFSGVVVCANRPGGFEELDDEVLLAIGGQAGAMLQNAKLHGELRSSYMATVRVLADAMEAKDGSLRGHGDEVARYAGTVADRLGLDAKRREEVVFGSLLHDVGKIGISERILLKPGPLSLEEFAVVRLHPRIGYRIVQQVPALDEIALGILHHHERWDGRGYPSGLRGEEIPKEARVIAVADSFSAMTSGRPYRRRLSIDDACLELERFAGSQFDPEVVGIFVDEIRRQPPVEDESSLGIALADPEFQMKLNGNETLIGHGSFALTDNLTLLYSHRYFHEVVAAEVQRASVQDSPFAVILVELEGITELNLREGYAAGDAAIQTAARIVSRVAAKCGGTAYRYGGRRLALVVPRVGEEAGVRLAGEIVDELAVGPGARTAVAAWRPGDTYSDVITRARVSLAHSPIVSRASSPTPT